MSEPLYQLPGRRAARQGIVHLAGFGILVAAVLGSWAGTQWLLHLGRYLGSPVWDLTQYQREGFAAALLLIVAWGVGLFRGLGRVPGWWGLLLLAVGIRSATVLPLYRPDGILRAWWYVSKGRLDSGTFEMVDEAFTAGVVVFFLLVVWIVACASSALRRLPRHGDTHGSAHFARTPEIRKAGFLPRAAGGVALGFYQGQLLRMLKDKHVLAYAPPGEGKTTALVVPTMLTWTDSVLIFDPKGEVFDWTSGYRHRVLGQDVCRMDLTSDAPRLARFNPLFTIPRGPAEIKSAQGLAAVMLPNPPKGDPFWASSAREFLVGLMLHVLYTEQEPTLTRCRERLLGGPIRELLAEMIETTHENGQPHKEIANSGHALLEETDKIRMSIVATVREALNLFADPYLSDNTSTSDVVISDLMDRDKPLSLYVTIPSGDVDRLGRVLRMLITQWLRELLNRGVGEDNRQHRLLLLLDEFPVLGLVEYLVTAGALLRGYGVQLYLIVQSVTQIRSIYGQLEALSGLCSVQLFLGTTDGRTALEVSQRLGKVTVETERESVTRSRTTVSDAEHARPLLGPDEVAGLSSDLSIILPSGACPILGDRLPFFDHPGLNRLVEEYGAVEESDLVRFDHDWSDWTRSRVKVATDDEIKICLEIKSALASL